jgi:hypothetical protein
VIFDCDFFTGCYNNTYSTTPTESFREFSALSLVNIYHRPLPIGRLGTQGKIYQYGQFSKHIFDRRLQVISMKHVKSFAFEFYNQEAKKTSEHRLKVLNKLLMKITHIDKLSL